MTGIKIYVNSDSLIRFNDLIDSLPKSAYPKVVRGTLNSLAFDVKKNTMLASAKRNFITRDKNFFRANSQVQMAKGFDVDSMYSMFGFNPAGRVKNKQSVENLEFQERGGRIDGRAYIPTDKARTAKNYVRMVARRNRIKNLRNVVVVANAPGKKHGQKFIQSVVHAGEKGLILTQDSLFRVDKMQRKDGSWKFRLTHLYSYKKGRSVRVKATYFMRQALDKTQRKTEGIYIHEVTREFNKHFNELD